MDSWNAQWEWAKRRITEIEDKIACQRQMAERLQNDDTSLPIPLISVLQESLVRAKTHAQFIEQRIAAHEADSGRRTTRTALIHVARIELTIAEYDREAIALDNAIQVEEDRTGIQDPAHVAYPAAAKGRIERRDNLMRLIDSLKRQLVHAKAPSHRRAMMKELLLLTLLAVLTFFPGSAFAQKAACSSLTITGHPEYPPIGYKDGERIVGAGATLVERIGGELKIPVQSKYAGSWAEAQMAARDGKVDIIFGIYFNDERANYLEYVRPAFLIDPVVVMVPKGKAFPFRGRQDLVGKKGVTNAARVMVPISTTS